MRYLSNLVLSLIALGLSIAAPRDAEAQIQALNIGRIEIGTKTTAGTWGQVNVADYDNDISRTLEAVSIRLSTTGGGFIDVLPGTYHAKSTATISGLGVEIRFAPNARIEIENTEEVGFLDLRECSDSRIIGGYVIQEKGVENQIAVRLDSGFRNHVSGLVVRMDEGTSDAAPMIGFLAQDETEGTFESIVILPNTGAIGIRDLRGSGNVWDRCKTSNSLNQDAQSSVFVGRNCQYGIDLYDCSFVQVRSGRAWALGTVAVSESKAALRIYGSGAAFEDGHTIIADYHAELCATQSYILLEGASGWVTIDNANLGLGNYSIGALGDAGIRLTRSTRTAKSSTAISAATSTFTLASGTWTETPDIGEMLITSGFSNSNNNSTWLVTASTSNSATVTKYDGTAASLTSETNSSGTAQTALIGRANSRISITNGMIHNVGRSREVGEGLFALVYGSLHSGQVRVNVSGGNTMTLASGTWNVTPVAGQWIRCLQFADSGNNGNFKIASATSNSITVSGTLTNASPGFNVVSNSTVNVSSATVLTKSTGSWTNTPSSGQQITLSGFTASGNNATFTVVSATSSTITVTGGLTSESGTGNETIVGLQSIVGSYPYEGSGLWAEYTDELDVRGLRIVDQRHQWGVSLDMSTNRGVVVDGITFHRGTSLGSVAPFRIPTATLLSATAGTGNYGNARGLGIGSVWLKAWGTTPAPFSDGTVGNSYGVTAPTITTTNAPYFPGLLGDNSTNYGIGNASADGSELTTIRNLGP